jgi:hypothetical protein
MRELLSLDPKEEQARVLELAFLRLRHLSSQLEATSSHVPLDDCLDDDAPPSKQVALQTARPTHASRTSAIVTNHLPIPSLPGIVSAKASTMSPLDLLAATAMQCQSPQPKANALSPDRLDEQSTDSAATSPLEA